MDDRGGDGARWHGDAHDDRHGDRPLDRPLGRSVKRGLRCRCPRCGEGRLFKAFLKPVERCAACGEDFSHQRADDLPAYLVIIVVGHVLMTGYLATDALFSLPLWATMAIWLPLAVGSAIATLQPIKGGVIALQWANRMHGFGSGDAAEP